MLPTRFALQKFSSGIDKLHIWNYFSMKSPTKHDVQFMNGIKDDVLSDNGWILYIIYQYLA